MTDATWITLAEAADLLGLLNAFTITLDLHLSTRAFLFTDDMLCSYNVEERLAVACRNGGIPVRMIPGSDYLYTSTIGSGLQVHAVSHVYRAAVEPWAAQQAVDLIQADRRRLYCPTHGQLTGVEPGAHFTCPILIGPHALNNRCGRPLERMR